MSAQSNTGSFLSTLKWIAIMITVGIFAFMAYKAYVVVTAPVRVAQDVGNKVSEKTQSMKNNAANVMMGQDVPVVREKTFDEIADAAFLALTKTPATPPKNIQERIFRSAYLRDADDRICALTHNFGNGPVQIWAAANNRTYATAKALNAKEDRIIRVHMETGDQDVDIRAYWNLNREKWAVRWRKTTLDKPISNTVAQDRLMEILRTVPDKC